MVFLGWVSESLSLRSMSQPESSMSGTHAQSLPAYDVFLSHRGPDVKRHFCAFLQHTLQRAGVRAFMDEKELEPGSNAWRTMQETLRNARIVIPVFWKGYAESSYCLYELALMMNGNKEVMPVLRC